MARPSANEYLVRKKMAAGDKGCCGKDSLPPVVHYRLAQFCSLFATCTLIIVRLLLFNLWDVLRLDDLSSN